MTPPEYLVKLGKCITLGDGETVTRDLSLTSDEALRGLNLR